MRNAALLTLIIAVVTLLTACTTVPLPSAHDESLFIVPIRFAYTHPERRLLRVTLTLRSASDDRSHRVTATPGSDVFSIALEPGRYFLDRVEAVVDRADGYQDDYWWDMRSSMLYAPVFSVVMHNRIIVVENWHRDDRHIQFSERTLSDATKERVIEKLADDPRWPAWETARKINFN